MEKLVCSPIGYIHSPFKDKSDTPKNSKAFPEKEGILEILKEFEEGIADIKVGDSLMVLFWFNKSKGFKLTVPFHGDGPMTGLFSTHSPSRPNPIGVTTVKVTKIDKRNIYFTGVDMFDGTPILDIKSAGHDV